MIESFLRPWFQRKCVDPLAHSLPLTPNRVTLLAALSGLGAAVLIPFTLWSLLLLLLSGYCDILDGTLARLKQKSSPFGTALDIVCDRFVEAAVIMGLSFAGPGRDVYCLLMLASVLLCVSSFLVVGIFSENGSKKSFYYHPGFIERAEAFGFFAVMILLPGAFTPLALLFTLGVLITTGHRLWEFRLKIVANTD